MATKERQMVEIAEQLGDERSAIGARKQNTY